MAAKTNLTYAQVVNWTTNVRKRNLKATVEGGKKPHHFLDFLFLVQNREKKKEPAASSFTRKRIEKPKQKDVQKSQMAQKPSSAVRSIETMRDLDYFRNHLPPQTYRHSNAHGNFHVHKQSNVSYPVHPSENNYGFYHQPPHMFNTRRSLHAQMDMASFRPQGMASCMPNEPNPAYKPFASNFHYPLMNPTVTQSFDDSFHDAESRFSSNFNTTDKTMLKNSRPFAFERIQELDLMSNISASVSNRPPPQKLHQLHYEQEDLSSMKKQSDSWMSPSFDNDSLLVDDREDDENSDSDDEFCLMNGELFPTPPTTPRRESEEKISNEKMLNLSNVFECHLVTPKVESKENFVTPKTENCFYHAKEDRENERHMETRNDTEDARDNAGCRRDSLESLPSLNSMFHDEFESIENQLGDFLFDEASLVDVLPKPTLGYKTCLNQ